MNRGALREVLLVFAAVTLATVGLSLAGRVPALEEHVPLAVAALFLWSAVQMSQRQPGGLRRYGLLLGGLLEPAERNADGPVAALRDLASAIAHALGLGARELAVALAVALAVFPPFALGFYWFNAPTHAFALRWPEGLSSYLLTQLLVVAIPEEALFRGYLQTRLGDAFPRRARWLGVELAPAAFLLQALLFALIHFAVDLNPARLAVFFPALLFGWVRELRGGIGAAAALHALCNLLSDVLSRSWF